MLAWSPEQPAIFPSSLRANLRVGAPHATDGQIIDLLEQLQLGPWLHQLELGLDTVIAPWGHPVSGGELQRLSVARAVLADRPVLLLDEPTSHLDGATADAVLKAVLERAADRSPLWVTHRPEELVLFPEIHSLAEQRSLPRRSDPATTSTDRSR
jgi:ATP-binding cassette, subfamily C, bacterial CydCD